MVAQRVTAQTLSFFGLPTPEQIVRITTPANHATFYTPVDIPIFAFVHEEGGQFGLPYTFTNVDFYYSGTNDLGQKFTNSLGAGFCLSSNNPPPVFPFQTYAIRPLVSLNPMYCLVWTNAPVGSFALTVVARRPLSLGTQPPPGVTATSWTSAPVNVTILASTTNSNPTDVVSIVATDPIAIAGTNACWIWPGITNTTPAWTNWPPPKWGYVTNWGPKGAVFTVRRFGNAATNLTVHYTIGGTASNGVDYVELPGSVTIPPGEAYALIPVVPMDHGVTNLSKTVVLALPADTNVPPAYTLGFPRQAAVLILDYWPRPLPWLLADRSFHLNTSGPDGAWFSVQNSPDLQNWTTVSTNQVIHGSIDYVDPGAPNYSSGFYRAVPLTNTSGN